MFCNFNQLYKIDRKTLDSAEMTEYRLTHRYTDPDDAQHKTHHN